MNEDLHSHKFTWDGGGKVVFVCGSFNSWQRIPMAKSRTQLGVFSTIVNLPRGRHEYKFLVDENWMLDINKEKSTNSFGQLNNICWISPEKTTTYPQVDSWVNVQQDCTPLVQSPLFEESDSDSSGSDTESVSSTSSGIDPASKQTFVKLRVQCPQSPLLVRDKLKQHLKFNGFSENVGRIQWKPSRRNAQGYSLVSFTPADMVDDAILKLNGSLLLGKFKLQIKLYKRRERGGRNRTGKKTKVGQKTKVFIGSLPRFVNEQHLQDHFRSFKTHIVRIDVCKDKETKQSKGFAFIVFSSPSPAEAAISTMNDTLLLNKHKIKVSFAKEDRPVQSPVISSPSLQCLADPGVLSSSIKYDDDASDTESISSVSSASASGELCQVFINSQPQLQDWVKDKSLRDHFSSYLGNITRIKVIRDKQKKSKGYAIATFSSLAVAEQAVVTLNNSMLLGQYKLNLHCKTNQTKIEPPSPIKLPIDSDRLPGRRNAGETATGLLSEVTPSDSSPGSQQQYAVKITCLPKSITGEGLSRLLQPHGVHKLPKIFEGKNRYALANFSSFESAQSAVLSLNKFVVDGYTIKASLKGNQTSIPASSPSDQPVTIGPPLQPFRQVQSRTVTATQQAPRSLSGCTITVDNLDTLVGDDELKSMINVQVLSIERVPSVPLRVLIRFKCFEDAQTAVQLLNGKSLLMKTIRASVIDTTASHEHIDFQRPDAYRYPPLTRTTVVPPLPHQQGQALQSHPPPPHQQGQALQSHPPLPHQQGQALQSHPPPPHQQGQALQSHPPPPHQQGQALQSHPPLPHQQGQALQSHPPLPHQQNPILQSHPHPPHHVQLQMTPSVPYQSHRNEEQIIKLTPEDWNRVMTIQSTGTSLFRDMIEPYKTNPSVEIKSEMDTLSVRISGVQEAVASAYRRVCNEVYKELSVPDSRRKESLAHLRPDLIYHFQQKYGVTLTGHNNSTPIIGFEGNTSNFPAARQELKMLLGSILMSEVKVKISASLLESARERCRTEGTKVCIFLQDSAPSVAVYSLDQYEMDKAVRFLSQGLYTEKIESDVVLSDEILSSISSHLVDFDRQESSVIVKSYLRNEVQEVTLFLRSKVDEASLQQVPFRGSPEEYAYLVHLNKTNHTAKELFSSLPARCTVKKNSIVLRGNPASIEDAQRLIRQELLDQLLTRRFVYHANKKFLSQLEDFVLKPVSGDLVWIKDFSVSSNTKPRSQGRRRMSSEGDDVEINLIVCSKNPDIFQQICACLEEVKPTSKRLALHQGAADSSNLTAMKPDLEKRFRVRIISGGRDTFLFIHGLTKKEVNDCWSEIDETVRSTHEIAKHIPLTRLQYLFLDNKRRQELDTLREDCSELHFLRPRNETEGYSLRIRGTILKVEAVSERVSETITSLITTEFSVEYETKFGRMWRKRWEQVKRERERSSDIVIDFDREAAAMRKPATTLYIVGTDHSEIEEVKELISEMATSVKKITLSASSAVTLRKDKKEFLHPLIVHMYVDSQSNEAVLTAPQDANDDLMTAEEEILKFLGERTMTSKNVTSDDEVVGLILTSRLKSAPYLARANSIAKSHGVKVYPLKKPQLGLRLSGSPAAIQAVELLIVDQVLKPIQQAIEQTQLKVKYIYSSVFCTSSFMQFNSKLQDEFCVSCTYPRKTNSNKVVRSAMIQPSSGARCLKLEICKGSIIFEEADAIVNAANEDLKHIGGLAKAILDTGGPTIQSDSDDYVRENGKLKAGQVVILGPGKLSCRSVIHAVGPRWQAGSMHEESTLYLTVYRSLEAANSAVYGTIVVPAISTGIFSVPENICARASLKAVQDFCQAFPNSSLHTVRFVLFRQDELKEFCSYFDSGSILKNTSSHKTGVLSSPATSAESVCGAWLWANDQGSYTVYTSEIIKQLATAFSKNRTGSQQFSMHGSVYRVDFSSMTQTNMSTFHQRRVKYDPSFILPKSETVQGAQWYYRDDHGGFSPYKPTESQSIERMHQANAPGLLQIGASMYSFDFASMCQTNTRTSYRRAIQRKEGDSPVDHPISKPRLSTTPVDSASASSPQKKDLCVILRGPRDTLAFAKNKLEKKLAYYIQKESIPVAFVFPPDFAKKLHSIALKHNVTCAIDKVVPSGAQKAQSLVKLEGINNEVQIAVKTIHQEIIDFQVLKAESSDLEMATPSEWQPQSSTTEVFPVTQGSAEWTKVKQKFKATLTTSQIVSISRIQNSWLWDKYCSHKKRLQLKNDGIVNEKELFHGTRSNDPKVIYEGEDGFDMRYSNQGMWGQANYFAVNASYSYNYSYNTPDGYREMFLVKVLTGDSYRCASNSSLRMPPVKGTSAGGKVQLSQMRYDTVTGQTGGSQVFMTYDNDKAYPAYLIKYR